MQTKLVKMDEIPVVNQPLNPPRRKRSQVIDRDADSPSHAVGRKQHQVPQQQQYLKEISTSFEVIDRHNNHKNSKHRTVDNSKQVCKKRGSNTTREEPPTSPTETTRIEEEDQYATYEDDDDDWRKKPAHVTTVSPVRRDSSTATDPADSKKHPDFHFLVSPVRRLSSTATDPVDSNNHPDSLVSPVRRLSSTATDPADSNDHPDSLVSPVRRISSTATDPAFGSNDHLDSLVSPVRRLSSTATDDPADINNNPDSHSQAPYSHLALTEERVRAFMVDYYDDYDSIKEANSKKPCWEIFFRQYCSENLKWIRPSGNPIGMEALVKLFTEDVILEKITLVSIENINIIAAGQAAVVVFTTDQSFTFKGVYNADRAVITCVIHVVNGREIKIVHEHRTVGRPIPKETRWSSTES
jgi:hypothetical protein